MKKSEATTQMREYLQILKVGDGALENQGHLPEIRMGLLGEHDTQQYARVLRGVFSRQGLFLNLYEAGFDASGFEIFDEKSGLYVFKPDYAYLSLCTQKYRDRFYSMLSRDRENLPQLFAAEIKARIERLQARGIQVIINSLALPLEGMFGNFSVSTAHSLYGSVYRANGELYSLVRGFPGVWVNDVMRFAAEVGSRTFIDERLWTLSRYFCAQKYLPEVARGVADIICANRGKQTKAIVVDLDNTLWGGVLADEGVDGILLSDAGPGEGFLRFQKYLKTLKDRGYILAVCSKNDEATALQPFREHPSMALKEKDISVFVANWEAKSSNIASIAKTLNIGLDSLVFIDDSPFERGEVSQNLPEVRVPEMPEDVAQFEAFLERGHFFETLAFSEEDLRRSELYSEERLRAAELPKYSNIDDYLSSLQMQVDCRRFSKNDLPRIAQLIQRSNQFNLRTQRFSQTQCEEFMLNTSKYYPISFSLKDRFGDYGLIGVICSSYRPTWLEINEWVMSCRVLKRGVEDYMLNTLVRECRRKGLLEIRGEYIQTPKNSLVKIFTKSSGLKKRTPTKARRNMFSR